MRVSFMVAMLLAGGLVGLGASAQGPIRVLTYNIHHGEGTDGIVDLDRIVSVIKEARADVVCLQEVDRNLPRTAKADFPAVLSEKLGMQVVFGMNYAFDGGEYGTATLTRLPLVEHENTPLPGPEGREPRGCLRTRVKVGDELVDVFNTHLGLESEERKEQVNRIMTLLGKLPVILAGDLNECVGDAAVSHLLTRLEDTLAEGEKGGTLLSGKAGKRIDFILVDQSIEAVSAGVMKTAQTKVASDHLPYCAEVRVRGGIGKTAEQGIRDNEDERVDKAIREGTR